MKKYKSFVRFCLKKKYKGVTNFDTSFLKSFFNYRKIFLKNILRKNNQVKTYKDSTFEKLKTLYQKDLNTHDQNKILKYYRKFEVNLALKKNYDDKFKKQSNLETNLNSYIYLGLLLTKCKILNIYHKLNCILKILDKISFNEKKINYIDKNSLIKLIKIENYLIKEIRNLK